MALRLLAFAVASGRASYVFFIGGEPKDWKITNRATASAKRLSLWADAAIKRLRPDVVVTEKPEDAKKKGEHTKELVAAIATVAANHELLDVSVPRTQDYANKYEEAAVLGSLYPDLAPWVPKKRRFFDNEPRNTVLFEAVALALVILRGPMPALARAMG